MASQFAAIYFQTTGIVSWILDYPAQPLVGFYHRSELLPSRIFNQSRKLHQFAISFMTLAAATLHLKVICI